MGGGLQALSCATVKVEASGWPSLLDMQHMQSLKHDHDCACSRLDSPVLAAGPHARHPVGAYQSQAHLQPADSLLRSPARRTPQTCNIS